MARIREAIGSDAGLPMPPIGIEPYAWTLPDGSILAHIALFPTSEGCAEWGVMLPVGTLLVVDDKMLRRILCHEFAHCFWCIAERIHAMGEGVFAFRDDKGIDELRAMAPEDVADYQQAKDKAELIDPALWFGDADTMAFLSELPWDATEERKSRDTWRRMKVPTRVPDLTIHFEGTLQYPQPIVDRIREIDGKRAHPSAPS
ncbi:MAG: hypothetical protein HYX92_05560 [Chloroflexi bacterium]|nr:hypothetical protein [Chloroflexota bacterium]